MSFNERLHNWHCPSWLAAIIAGLFLGSTIHRVVEGDTTMAVLDAAIFAMWAWILVQAFTRDVREHALKAKKVDLRKKDRH